MRRGVEAHRRDHVADAPAAGDEGAEPVQPAPASPVSPAQDQPPAIPGVASHRIELSASEILMLAVIRPEVISHGMTS
jgi:hypothetical protein